MTDRYPLVIDVTDKKLKELPIGDSLRIDGDIIINNGEIKINGESLTINYEKIVNPPFIPIDISDLSDNQELLTLSKLIKLTTIERDELTSQPGDIIYNTTESAVQVYVDILSWSDDSTPEPIPGWVNLYTPPLPPE